MQALTLTNDNYPKELSSMVTADGTAAQRIQRFVEFGFAHYDATNDSTPLTAFMNAGFKSVRTEAVKLYIQAHTNLTLRKDKKDGVMRFKKDKTSTAPKYTAPTKTWCEWSGAGLALPMNIEVGLQSFISKYKKALAGTDEKKKLKDGTHDITVTLVAGLERLLATAKAPAPVVVPEAPAGGLVISTEAAAAA